MDIRSVPLLVALLSSAILSSTNPADAAISDCIDATCRITEPGGGRGTGCVFEISQGRVYVLTAAHVVGQSRQVQCEFWRHGHQSRPLAGQVVSRDEQADAAIVAIGQTVFGEMLPPAIPVAGRDFILRPGDPIVSVGCAGGSWSTGFRGHVLGYQGTDLHFVPGPANGRSGSAIFDAAGQRIVGVLRARSLDDSKGIATSVQGLYRVFGSPSGASGAKPRAAGGHAQCPGGSCPTPWHLSPYRHYTDERLRQLERQQPAPNSPWPTLPPAAPVPQTDLRPIEDKLDAVRQEVQTTQEENSRLHEAVTGLRGLVDQVVGDRETLRERMETRIEKVKAELGEDAGKPEIVRAYVRDLLAEKLGDPALGMSAGKMVGAALGLSAPLAFALAVAAWLVSRRVGSKLESGEPLLLQKMFDRLGDKLDDLKDRVRDQPSSGPTKP